MKISKTLIVEDNAVFRKTLAELLCSRFPAMVFEEAREGKEALEKIHRFHPHLVFMDIKLPGESGLDLTKKIKDVYSDIIVIILTSYNLPEYREAAKQNGADYFVTKGSSTASEIMELVETILANLEPTSAPQTGKGLLERSTSEMGGPPHQAGESHLK